MKKEYNIKDRVWIHIGEPKLTEGRVVEIIDLEHLDEGHDPNYELYVIELKTGIDDVYEIRSFEQISPDAKGPINLFRKDNFAKENRLLKKLGMPMPLVQYHVSNTDNPIDFPEMPEPTPEQIHAAMERSTESVKIQPILKPAVKKRYNNNAKRKKQQPKQL
jgi:hypothetical protein